MSGQLQSRSACHQKGRKLTVHQNGVADAGSCAVEAAWKGQSLTGRVIDYAVTESLSS